MSHARLTLGLAVQAQPSGCDLPSVTITVEVPEEEEEKENPKEPPATDQRAKRDD